MEVASLVIKTKNLFPFLKRLRISSTLKITNREPNKMLRLSISRLPMAVRAYHIFLRRATFTHVGTIIMDNWVMEHRIT